jgi:magnesium chelatase family protein
MRRARQRGPTVRRAPDDQRGHLSNARQIKRHCQLSVDSQELIRVPKTELNLSARAYDRILKVSRPDADHRRL